MQNIVPLTRSELLMSFELAARGAAKFGPALPLVHNNDKALKDVAAKLLGSITTLERGRDDLDTLRSERDLTVDAAREFLFLSRDLLKRHLGKSYSPRWDTTGFRGSLRVPELAADVAGIVQALHEYFLAHPDHEVAGVNVTAVKAAEVHTALCNAASAVNEQVAKVGDLVIARDQATTQGRSQMRWLIEELGQLLPPLDQRWKAFGLNMPGAQETPDVPENLHVTLIGNTAAALKWDAAPRAEYYRVWKRVVGVDEALVAVGSPADLDFTIEELPSNSEIEIAVSAVNNGGESAVSEVRKVRTVAGLPVTPVVLQPTG